MDTPTERNGTPTWEQVLESEVVLNTLEKISQNEVCREEIKNAFMLIKGQIDELEKQLNIDLDYQLKEIKQLQELVVTKNVQQLIEKFRTSSKLEKYISDIEYNQQFMNKNLQKNMILLGDVLKVFDKTLDKQHHIPDSLTDLLKKITRPAQTITYTRSYRPENLAEAISLPQRKIGLSWLNLSGDQITLSNDDLCVSHTGEPFSLVFTKNQLSPVVTSQIKIRVNKVQQQYVGVGIGLVKKSLVEKKITLLSQQQLCQTGHDSFLIFNDGHLYHSTDPNLNGKRTEFFFNQGDVINITYNPNLHRIIFEKERTKLRFILQVGFSLQLVHFAVWLDESEVEIIDQFIQ